MRTRRNSRSSVRWLRLPARLGVVLALPVLVASGVRAQSAQPAQAEPEPHGEFLMIECQRSAALVVRLRVRRTASPADRDWLQFEFDNLTAQPLRLASVGFQIDGAEAFDPETGKLLRQQGLGQGNTSDLFFGSATPAGVTLPPGITRAAEHASGYATALLGMPPTGGWRVTAHVKTWVSLPGGQAASSDGRAPAFEFRWMPPDAAGLTELRKIVVELLQQPRLPGGSIYLASMLLAQPDISGPVGLPRLLAVRDSSGEKEPSSPWTHVVLPHLNRAFANDASLVAWVKGRLASSDQRIVAELHRMPNVWDPSFLSDLLRRYEAGDRSVLELLERRGAPHRTDVEATRRLSAPLVAGFRSALPSDLDKRQAMDRRTECQRQARMIHDLGSTRDSALVPLLLPWLECRELLHDGDVSEIAVDGYRIPQRICDVALEAIQRLLDEDPRAAFSAAVGDPFRFRPRLDWAAVAVVRDRMITGLKERLASAK